MELNIKGLTLKVNEAYPCTAMLELYLSKPGAARVEPILTLGSDARRAEDVGGCLLEGAAILGRLGVCQLTRFEAHKRSSRSL